MHLLLLNLSSGVFVLVLLASYLVMAQPLSWHPLSVKLRFIYEMKCRDNLVFSSFLTCFLWSCLIIYSTGPSPSFGFTCSTLFLWLYTYKIVLMVLGHMIGIIVRKMLPPMSSSTLTIRSREKCCFVCSLVACNAFRTFATCKHNSMIPCTCGQKRDDWTTMQGIIY